VSDRRATTKKTSIMIDANLLDKADRLAAIDGVSRSVAIEKLMKNGLDVKVVMDAMHLFKETLRVIDKRLMVIEANTTRDN